MFDKNLHEFLIPGKTRNEFAGLSSKVLFLAILQNLAHNFKNFELYKFLLSFCDFREAGDYF